MGIPFKDVNVYRKIGKECSEAENAKLKENLTGPTEGSVSIEMDPPDYGGSRMAISEVCVVEDFLWPS